ncbi:hypothetical protein F4780DRAFT_457534 [Xylariomycetidae sp. FL0641]|nr:hypothetical protein F4780DRAFT_457534 [Xylariomycetidae sp. FL0641]
MPARRSVSCPPLWGRTPGAAIASRADERAWLLELPAEIRDHIFADAVVEDTEIYMWMPALDPTQRQPITFFSLRATCRLIYADLHRHCLFYRDNAFVFLDPWALSDFQLRLSPKFRSTTRNLRLLNRAHPGDDQRIKSPSIWYEESWGDDPDAEDDDTSDEFGPERTTISDPRHILLVLSGYRVVHYVTAFTDPSVTVESTATWLIKSLLQVPEFIRYRDEGSYDDLYFILCQPSKKIQLIPVMRDYPLDGSRDYPGPTYDQAVAALINGLEFTISLGLDFDDGTWPPYFWPRYRLPCDRSRRRDTGTSSIAIPNDAHVETKAGAPQYGEAVKFDYQPQLHGKNILIWLYSDVVATRWNPESHDFSVLVSWYRDDSVCEWIPLTAFDSWDTVARIVRYFEALLGLSTGYPPIDLLIWPDVPLPTDIFAACVRLLGVPDDPFIVMAWNRVFARQKQCTSHLKAFMKYLKGRMGQASWRRKKMAKRVIMGWSHGATRTLGKGPHPEQ